MSELGEAFIMQGIEANVMPSKREELEKASTIWAEKTEREELEF